ncbi:glycoside hydrolase family 88 protein [Hebeloma cylindrosporum]|uniref:Glycoside hydrolase family 88 protein n=1 Tax=Hebeloma cylindrosporum TaxID=76867 RepID=A0A0C2YIA0_HEBCY|nr:glycoside hydrolase family 88 protein [Hebeloma cylindrosporum h7]
MVKTSIIISTFPLSALALAAIPSELFASLLPQKVLDTFNALPSPIQYPQYTDTVAGEWVYFSPDTWTSGFLPTIGYAMNTRKALCGATPTNGLGSADWLSLARSASNGLLSLNASRSIAHDVGFISFPFVEELALNPNNQTAINAVNRFAAMLAARFSPVVGCTRSWDTSDPTDFQVIIDNMMNLEVLFRSADLTGNSTLRKIATTHADTTMKNHIRADGSTWHVVEYNSTTGLVIKKRTSQGFSDDSTWSRGQAWGIYGFANMYRFTNNTSYLTTAQRLATYFLNSIPSDGIVPWDFNAPLTPAPRPADSSAATLAVNALLLLAQQESAPDAKQKWIGGALQILANITTLAWKPSWQSLLSNGTVNKPSNNFLTGIVYGDYYYIKAGNELVSMGLANCTTKGATSLPQSQKSSAHRLTISFPCWWPLFVLWTFLIYK